MSWRLNPSKTAVLIVDVQEKMMPAICEKDEVLRKVRILAEGARALGLPIYLTEQYPKGLGSTVPEIRDVIADIPVLEKTAFSAGEFASEIKQSDILVAGVETHICIRQTMYDLRMKGKNPQLVADATASRDHYNKQIALSELQSDKFILTTVEACLFELLESKEHPAFKEISRLVK